ncbi:hypothetical protein L7F22_050445 [Adiantum nelumboides]|nr:hypothetical protein [Adiantum nelumboides]
MERLESRVKNFELENAKLKEEVASLKEEMSASKELKEEGEIQEVDKVVIKEEITKELTKAMEVKLEATKEGWVDIVSAIGTQWFSVRLDRSLTYEQEVAPARTFCIAEQIPGMQAAGLIKGGSVDNAIICRMNDGWLNPPLRFSDEPCRHKLLDLIGDVALCAENGNSGLPNAHIVAFKAGHLLHTRFSLALLQAKEHQRRKG